MENHLEIHTIFSTKDKKVVKRWKEKNTNKRLKKVIQLTTEAQDYAHKLVTENLLHVYDGLNGQLQTPRVWQIQRTLFGQGKPSHSHTA